MLFSQEQLKEQMAFAYELATRSPDTSNQNGAVICNKTNAAGDLERIAKGYNHFYKGIPPEIEDRDRKLQRIEHAERDAIFYAASRGHACSGTIMICPWAACYDCARAIIGAEIKGLVYHKERYDQTAERWKGAVDEALDWLDNNGIWLIELSGPIIKAPPIIVNGEKWSPAGLVNV